MVVSLPDLRAAALFAGLLLLPALVQSASPRAVAGGSVPSDEYVLDGRDMRIDTRANQMRVSDVTITQGGIRVHATEAMAQGEKQSFNSSRWEFTGDVSIRFKDGSLDADKATVTIVGNRIVRATADGAPARFEQKLASMTQPARGRAKAVDFDVPANKVRLSGDVVFSDGRNEFEVEALDYDLGTQVVEKKSTDPGRVQMTIRRNDAAEGAPPAPPPAPAPVPVP